MKTKPLDIPLPGKSRSYKQIPAESDEDIPPAGLTRTDTARVKDAERRGVEPSEFAAYNNVDNVAWHVDPCKFRI